MLNFLICIILAILTVHLWRIDEHVYSVLLAVTSVMYVCRGLIVGLIAILCQWREHNKTKKRSKEIQKRIREG